MPARITHNEGTITGSKEHVYTEFILVGGGNLNHGGQVIKNFARIKCKTNVIISIGAGNIKGCPSSITWSASDNTKAQITSDYGFEYLKDRFGFEIISKNINNFKMSVEARRPS